MIKKWLSSYSPSNEEFIRNLISRYLPFIEHSISQILKDENLIQDILQKIVKQIIKNSSTIQKLGYDRKITYIIYMVKAILRKNSTENFQSYERCFYREYQSVFWRLSEEERDLIIYKDFMEYSNTEICEIMNIPVENIESKIKEAKLNLVKTYREGDT